MTKKFALLIAGACVLLAGCQSSNKGPDKDGWYNLFDGKSLEGWTVNENAETFSVTDGTIKVNGDRGHLFYTGPVMEGNFTNFEWKADVMTMPQANSGMYFHTKFQPSGWPDKGYEVQVNNTQKDWRRTGSLYSVEDVREAPANDKEWFTQHIIVKDKRIIIKVNGKTTVDYTEPEKVSQSDAGRKISSGTFALQGHDPGSTVYYKNIMAKPLP